MNNSKNDKKIESIFAITEVRKYIAEVIDKNIKKYNLPLGEFEWSLAFLETYKKLKTGKDKKISKGQNHSTEISNYIITNSRQRTYIFLKELFILIALLEREKIIENSEDFTGEMFAFIFDPERSYLEKESRDNIIKDIRYIFNRHGRDIILDNVSRRYIFKKIPPPQLIDKDAISLYNNKIFISDKIINYINENSVTITFNVKPSETRILKYLIGKGRGNIDNWLTKEDIANNLSLSHGTVANIFSYFRNDVYKIIGINLIEEKGKDKDGKYYRINHIVL